MTRKLALFDFDGTMIKGDSIARLVRHLFLKKKMSLKELCVSIRNTLLWKLGKMPVEEVKAYALSPLLRMGLMEREQFLKRFVLGELAPRIYQDAVETMRRHKEDNRLVLLVSASPLCYMQTLSEVLPLDDIIATVTDDALRVRTNVVGEEKVRQIGNWLKERGIEADFNASHAYGDSSNDLPMLGMVGHPHLCNPHRKARKKAPEMPVLIWR